jgi:tetratricopeptide (TPR) repeat protein
MEAPMFGRFSPAITGMAAFIVTVLTVGSTARAELREWVDSDKENSVMAEFIGFDEDSQTVQLRLKNGKIASAPLSKLSGKDRLFVQNNRERKTPFDDRLAANPQDVEALYGRGLTYLNRDQLDKARADFDTALKVNPSYAPAIDGRGMVYSRSGELEKAHDEFSRAIQIDPSYPAAYKNRGDNLEKMSMDSELGKKIAEEEQKRRGYHDEALDKKYRQQKAWQPQNATTGNITRRGALMLAAQDDLVKYKEIVGSGGYGGVGGGVGVNYGAGINYGAGVTIAGPNVTVAAPGVVMTGAPLQVNPVEAIQGETIYLTANPAELAKALPPQIDAESGKRRPAIPGDVKGVDFYLDTDGDQKISPGDQYLASDLDRNNGFTAEVDSSELVGTQTFFAAARDASNSASPAELQSMAEQLAKAAKDQATIKDQIQAAANNPAMTAADAQAMKDAQGEVYKAAQELLPKLGVAPSAAEKVSGAISPIKAVGNRLKSAEASPGPAGAEQAGKAVEKASEAAEMLAEAAASLQEKADNGGTPSAEDAAKNPAQAAGSGNVKPAPTQVAKGGPGEGGPGKGGEGYGGEDKPGSDGDDVVYRDSDDDIVIRDGDHDRDRTIIIDEDERDLVVDRAHTYIDDRNYDRAVVEYDRLVDYEPENVEYVRERAGAYLMDGRYDYAIRDYSSILLETESADLYYNRGCASLAVGELEDALADFDASIRLDETRNLAFNNRGITKARLGHFEEAVKDFTAALALEPNDKLALRNRALAYRKLGKTELAELDQSKLND